MDFLALIIGLLLLLFINLLFSNIELLINSLLVIILIREVCVRNEFKLLSVREILGISFEEYKLILYFLKKEILLLLIELEN